MEFSHEENRIALYSDDGAVIAEVTFPADKDGAVKVERTFVDGSLRGQGVAGQLMLELVSELRHSKRKAALTCSYAVSWFEKHPEYADVLKQ